MADPISIIGLVLDLTELITRLYKYGKAVKGAKEDVLVLAKELSGLQGTLEQIKTVRDHDMLLDDDIGTIVKSDAVAVTLRETQVFIKTLLEKLEPKESFKQKTVQMLSWPFTKDKIQEHLVFLERVKSGLTLAMVGDVSGISATTLSELRGLNMLVVKEHEARLRQEEDARSHRLRQKLCSLDVSDMHRRACRAWQPFPDTGSWFINSSLHDWYNPTQPKAKQSVMFLKAKSGAGKTTLFSHCVETIRKPIEQSNGGKVCLAFFYVSLNEEASRPPYKVLAGLVAQLSRSHPEILDHFDRHDPFKSDKKDEEDLDVLVKAILHAAAVSDRVLLMVDAINEGRDIPTLMKYLMSLLSCADNIQLFLTGTLDVPTRPLSSLPYFDTIAMWSKPVDSDIDAYIQSRFNSSSVIQSMRPAQVKEIRLRLVRQADGMFRYVQFLVDYLCSQRQGKLVKQAVDYLPDSLYATYALTLRRIPHTDRHYARAALLWLSYSMRALPLSVLADFLVVEEGMETLRYDDRLPEPEFLLEICQGLIETDVETGNVRLAHASVRAFLTSDNILETDARYFALNDVEATRLIIRRCLTVVMFREHADGYVRRRDLAKILDREYSIYDYAATRWAMHAGDTTRFPTSAWTQSDLQWVMRFFNTYMDNDRHGSFGFWVRYLLPDLPEHNVKITQPLYYAASFGIIPVLQHMFDSGLVSTNQTANDSPGQHRRALYDIDAKGGRNESTALHVACFRGYREVARMLVDFGANLRSRDAFGATPLNYVEGFGMRDFFNHTTESRPIKEISDQEPPRHDSVENSSRVLELLPIRGRV